MVHSLTWFILRFCWVLKTLICWYFILLIFAANRTPGQVVLDWPIRLKIAKGVTRALDYLYKIFPDLNLPPCLRVSIITCLSMKRRYLRLLRAPPRWTTLSFGSQTLKEYILLKRVMVWRVTLIIYCPFYHHPLTGWSTYGIWIHLLR